jgi:hypothetical protein
MIMENGNDEHSAAPLCYAEISMYQLAGEFYGRLKTALGCGHLTMYADGPSFVYTWEITDQDGDKHRSQLLLDSRHILVDLWLIDRAEYIANNWLKTSQRATA